MQDMREGGREGEMVGRGSNSTCYGGRHWESPLFSDQILMVGILIKSDDDDNDDDKQWW